MTNYKYQLLSSKAMTNIHGAIFIIIGGVVFIFSILLKELFVFAYVGGAFILWGIGKLLLKKKPKPKTHPKTCQRCHKQVGLHDNYCAYCGMSLKHYGSYPHFHKSGHYQYHNRNYNQVRRVP